MLRYRRTIQSRSNSGQPQAMHQHSGNQAMVRSSASLACGLDHLFNLGNNPLALFRDIGATYTEVPNMCQSERSEINDDLDRKAVEQELQRYEEDGISDTKSLVAFWEVRMPILYTSDFFRSHRLYYRNMNMFTHYFSTLRWMYCLLKQPLCLVKESSHQVRKPARCVATSLTLLRLRCSKF